MCSKQKANYFLPERSHHAVRLLGQHNTPTFLLTQNKRLTEAIKHKDEHQTTLPPPLPPASSQPASQDKTCWQISAGLTQE